LTSPKQFHSVEDVIEAVPRARLQAHHVYYR
jgi:hypothetical protein